jgi:hypothetical protein
MRTDTRETIVLFLTICFLGQGCCIIHATNAGKTWETFAEYKAAYVYKNQLAVSYTVTDPLAKVQPTKIAERWASVDLVSQQPLKAKAPLHTHRFPLPARISEKGQPVPIAQAAAALPKGEPLSIKVRDPGVFLIAPVMLPLAVATDVILFPIELIPDPFGGRSMIEWARDDDPWKHPPNPNNSVQRTATRSTTGGG